MRRLLLSILLAALCAGWTWDSAHGATRPVYIVDQSALVHPSDVANALPAFQAAVSQDFARYWGQDAELVATATPPADGWTILIRDRSDLQGALGYHTASGETPYAKVFAQDAVKDGDTWQGVLTHELFEMLADPYINRLALSARTLWLVEVADPVEADTYNYARKALNGSAVPISDFVTPAWYRPNGHKPFDFAQHVRKPGQLLLGGYANYWDYGWHAVYGTAR